MKTTRRPWPFLAVTAITATLYIATWARNVKHDLDKAGQ